MTENLINDDVVVDLASPYVCLGRLVAMHEQYLELRDADLHDLRDTRTSRENYVVSAVQTGIKRNRKTVFVSMRDVVAIARLSDVVID
ncbi:MAG: hypothetical protein U0793_17520 [Gemmataceae bacterium]